MRTPHPRRLGAALALVGLCWAAPLSAQPSHANDELERGFEQPPPAALPRTWWHWVDGCVTQEGITADLEEMKRVGIGGAQMFSLQLNLRDPITGKALPKLARFLSPQWRDRVRFAVSECKRLGIEFSILDCEGWGEGGGRTVTPAEGMQMVVWSTAQVAGGRSVPLSLPRPVVEPRYYEDISLLAFPSVPGDEPASPAITASASTSARDGKELFKTLPLFTLPMPWPGRPQWLLLDYGTPHTFRTVFLAMNDMRDVEDPDDWEHSPYLNPGDRQLLHRTPGPHYFVLQASDDGSTFRSIGRISTHGTTSFVPTTARYFRIWMPVPAPLQRALPFKGTEPMEVTAVSLGGARVDRPETRAGQYVDYGIRAFSGKVIPVDQAIDHRRIIDLTGRTAWDAPPGNWTLLRIGHASTGAQIGPADLRGLEADKLSRTAVWNFLSKGSVGTVLADSAPEVGKTIKFILCDSWEKGYENWTPRMREEFKRRRGYDIGPWLPALAGRVVDSMEASERFLWDFRRTISDLLAENYYGTMQEFAHAHGMGVTAEATGHGLPTIADQLLCKGRTDVPMGEFWVGRALTNADDTKEAASAAHIYGQNIAGAESFTAVPEFGSWTRDPFMLKPEGDFIFCQGINRLSMHHFVHQPWSDKRPGVTMGQWGSNLERGNTWWADAAPWYQYLGRCQYLLMRGRFVADLCYFYGEDTPVDFTFAHLSPKRPAGYDLDACNTEILERMTVENGRLKLPSGMSYRVLVLPDSRRMTPRVIRQVRRLVAAGATVVGPKPDCSPSLAGYPDCDRVVRSIADEVWKSDRVYSADRLAEALKVPPDFSAGDAPIHYIHRRDGDTEIYFLANQSQSDVTPTCTFRVAGLAPELWHPDSGQREPAGMYAVQGERTSLPIHFDPAGSVFVVFRRPASSAPPRAAPTVENGLARELTGRWTVTFPPHLGAPPEMTLDRLASWTDSKDDGVRHFSGTATYRMDFDVAVDDRRAGDRHDLDLGLVKNLCHVWLNGTDLGILWKPPFRVDVSSALRAGTNHLKVEVTNLWPNRLIGDLQLPPSRRIAWTTFNPFHLDSPLLPSGLLGPVFLRSNR